MHEKLPFLITEVLACRWIQFQEALLHAPNTVNVYAYGINDWIAFCHHNGLTIPSVGQDSVALYVRTLHIDHQLSTSTIRQRLTIVRLYYNWLCDRNPVRHGVWQNGGKGQRGIIPVQHKLPWIPDEADWLHFLSITAQTDIRTRVMLMLACDCTLRREELCTITTGDIDPARRLLTIRAENTKNRCA